MTTITAIPDSRTASVRLVIGQTHPVTTLVRADSNGTRPVRVFENMWPSSGKGELVVIDYEPALTGEVQYRLGTTTENISVWTSMQGVQPAPAPYVPPVETWTQDGQNLAPNPRAAGSGTAFSQQASGNAITTTVNYLDGPNLPGVSFGTFARQTLTAATSLNFLRLVVILPAAPGVNYTARVKARTNRATAQCRVGIGRYTGGTFNGETFGARTTPGANTWVDLVGPTVTLGEGQNSIRVMVDIVGISAGDYLDVSAVLVSTDAALPYFDGGTVPTGGYRFSWAGSPHASTSIREKRSYLEQGNTGPVQALAPVEYLPRFMLPAIPYLSRDVQTVHVYDAARASRATVHNVLGRNDPIIVQGRLETRRGNIAAVFESYAAALEVIQIMERGQAVFYRQTEHAGMDMYFVANRIGITPAENLWIVSIEFIEIDSPTSGIASAEDWTFTQLAKTGGTFDEVASDYRSFTELALGESGV